MNKLFEHKLGFGIGRENRLAMKTMYDVRVSGIPDTAVIDHDGNFRPSAVFGSTYFVDGTNGADTNNGLSKGNARKTLTGGLAKVTTNHNDLLLLNGNGAITETAMVDNSKSRFTILGVGGNRRYGQGAKIYSAIAAGATNIATWKNTGVRVTVANVKFEVANTVAESLWGIAEGGEYTEYDHCEFYKSTDLDVTTSAEVLLNGDSTQFRKCTFGSLADARVGTVIRPTVWLGKGVVGTGLVCRDVTFDDCEFWIRASHTTSSFVHAPAATDVERKMSFKHGCAFIAAKNSGATPAQAISGAATLTVGEIIVDPTCYAVGCTKLSTTTGVMVTGAAPAAGQGIAVNAA